jgi:hypothetical protein
MTQLAELRRTVSDGDAADRWYVQGEQYAVDGRENLAIRSLREALLIRPAHQQAGLLLANILHQQWNVGTGGWPELGESSRLLARHAPEDADWLRVRASQCTHLGRDREALELFERSLERNPADHMAAFSYAGMRWRLGVGTYAECFPWHNRRLDAPERAPRLLPGVPLWDGRPLQGNLLLYGICDGIGDSILGARYAPLARQRVGGMSLICQSCQERLFSRIPGIDYTYPQDLDPSPEDFEAFCPLMSLIGAMGGSEHTIPRDPYLSADAATIERWRPRLAGLPGLKVGVVWQGEPKNAIDRFRSFKLAALAPVAAVPGVSMVSLQYGHGCDQVEGAPFPILDLGPEFQQGDLMDTAAVISQLDLVIACESCVAHLVGAMGTPVWVALSEPADYRWEVDREDSPWFPSARLFRQKAPGGWPDVFTRMASRLRSHHGLDLCRAAS